jgi:hypothetical protein
LVFGYGVFECVCKREREREEREREREREKAREEWTQVTKKNAR